MILKITLSDTLDDEELEMLEEVGFTPDMALFTSVVSCLKDGDRLEYQLASSDKLFFDDSKISSLVTFEGIQSIAIEIGDTLHEFKVDIAIADNFPFPDHWIPEIEWE